MMDETDRLVRDVLAGRTESFADLVRLYGPDVWREVSRLLRDRDASDNLLQQVFVDAYMHLATYQPRGNFRGWIIQIARNRLRNELRSYSRQNRRLAHYRDLQLQRLSHQEADEARTEEMLEALGQCQELLAPHARRVLQMRYEQGVDVDTIAACEGNTATAVRKVLSRARLLLRDCIRNRMEGGS
jgi:RNA polymerase sigma-70 factor (ECF subfamily)